MRALALLAALAATPLPAETLVAAQTIRAKTVLSAADVVMLPQDVAGTLSTPDQVEGQEARVTLYAGRPIRPGDIGPPAVIERNQIVPLVYASATLTIMAEARALERAGVGDRVRAMNLSSRTTVFGTVAEDGSIYVTGGLQ